MVGRVFLGKYKILRLLDEGGMSRVYLARQTNPDREVVVKLLNDAHLKQPKAFAHFRREIHITSRFQHPFAVGFYDGDSGQPARPRVGVGISARRRSQSCFASREAFTVERTGRLLAQLCSVLQAAHNAGLIHRDVKPGNLMIEHPGEPLEQLKLMDFGLAKMSSLLYIAPDEVFDCTLPPAAGTPEYIAPEQVRGNEIDHRADLYSVGVLLFEMLTGQRPFVGATLDELLSAHADQPPPTFAELGLANLGASALERLVRDCLAKNPERRPASASELLRRYELAVGRSFPLPSGLGATKDNGTAEEASATAAQAPDEDQTVEHCMEVSMPESMALLKLKGFIHNLGGEIVESVPGLSPVRASCVKKPSLIGWIAPGRKTPLPTALTAAHIELRMSRLDPSRPGQLTVALVMRSSSGTASPEWRTRCDAISRDLRAYLMGR